MGPVTTPTPETDLSDPIQAAIRCSRSVQTTIGWIFWDPGAVGRYAELGLPGPVGYIAAPGHAPRPGRRRRHRRLRLDLAGGHPLHVRHDR